MSDAAPRLGSHLGHREGLWSHVRHLRQPRTRNSSARRQTQNSQICIAAVCAAGGDAVKGCKGSLREKTGENRMGHLDAWFATCSVERDYEMGIRVRMQWQAKVSIDFGCRQPHGGQGCQLVVTLLDVV